MGRAAKTYGVTLIHILDTHLISDCYGLFSSIAVVVVVFNQVINKCSCVRELESKLKLRGVCHNYK